MLRSLIQHLRSDDQPDGANIRVIVGLGNPGMEYANTRHNAGFMVVDDLQARQRATGSANRFGALVDEVRLGNQTLVLCKPLTYMNNSGVAVAQLVTHYKLPLQNLLVIYDELDLAFGRLQLRPGGGPGGHNGMKSILKTLGTQDIARLRFGIGRPAKGSSIDYVLGHFDDEQIICLPELISDAAVATESWIKNGIQIAMNEVNQRSIRDHIP